jgi:hypothetical protein
MADNEAQEAAETEGLADETAWSSEPETDSESESAPEGQAEGDGESGVRSGTEVSLGRNVKIDLTQRLPLFDRPNAQAFAATDARSPGEPRYAVICSEEAPPRMTVLPKLSRLDYMPCVVPMDWGRVIWDEQGTRKFAVVLEQPTGAPICRNDDVRLEPMREDRIVEKVIRPVHRALGDLAARMVTHRAIYLQNVFINEAAGGDYILGDCVSAPVGTLQPAVFETIPGGQASPIGRGAGGISDDLYALGVLLAMLIRGGNPMAGWSTQNIVAQKIERGSYAALMGRQRISLKMMEPLRGLLCDEVRERWTLDDLEMWLNGRQLSPKQASLPHKARRAFDFLNDGYWNAKSLAHAMANNWRDALPVVWGGEIEHWAGRSLPDEKHAKAIVSTLATTQSTGTSGDRALARLLIALDPAAPIRLHSLAVKVEAIHSALALSYDDPVARQRVAEMILGKLPQHWLNQQPEDAPDPPQPLPPFDRMSYFLERRALGQGIERCLYEFNPEWPCLSPLVRGQYVLTLKQLMMALERRAERTKPDREPIDRHIVAFVAARMENMPERVMQGLTKADDPVTYHRAALHFLARIQRNHGPEQLPALCQWVRPQAERIINSLHNNRTKEKHHKMLNHAVDTGSLVEVLAAVDDPQARKEDEDGFEQARQDYAQNLREMTWLESGGLTADQHVAVATRNWATAVSALLSGLITMLATVFYIS